MKPFGNLLMWTLDVSLVQVLFAVGPPLRWLTNNTEESKTKKIKLLSTHILKTTWKVFAKEISARSEKTLRYRHRWSWMVRWVHSLARCLQESAKANDTFQAKIPVKFTTLASQLSLCSEEYGDFFIPVP